MKKQLSTVGDLEEALLGKKCIVIHKPKRSTKKRTKIHHDCKNLKMYFRGRYGVKDENLIGSINDQQAWLYDSYDDILSDFPNAAKCQKCGSSY